MGKLRCERVIDERERVFVLPNRQNIRVKKDNRLGWVSESGQVYRDLETIRRKVMDFINNWESRVQPRAIPIAVHTSAVMTGLGTEAETVEYADGYKQKRSESRRRSHSHRVDTSATANFAVPLCDPTETRRKAESAEATRKILERGPHACALSDIPCQCYHRSGSSTPDEVVPYHPVKSARKGQ